MKKHSLVMLMLLAVMVLLAGCQCKHVWQEATCNAPRTCESCGETEGMPLEHVWQEASCTAPKTCTLCGEASGEVLEHSWQSATCEAPETCSGCSQTQGEALGHDWQEATCQQPKTCTVCQTSDGEAAEHQYTPVSYTATQCFACGAVGETFLVPEYTGDPIMKNGAFVVTHEVLGLELFKVWDKCGSAYVPIYRGTTDGVATYVITNTEKFDITYGYVYMDVDEQEKVGRLTFYVDPDKMFTNGGACFYEIAYSICMMTRDNMTYVDAMSMFADEAESGTISDGSLVYAIEKDGVQYMILLASDAMIFYII